MIGLMKHWLKSLSLWRRKVSKQIARRIEAHREQQPIETTLELVDIIKEGIPAKARRKGGHPAKRIFQAIRIAVNDELSAFEDSIEQAIEHVKVKGRISVITFHSLEDRLCKQISKNTKKDLTCLEGYQLFLKLIHLS